MHHGSAMLKGMGGIHRAIAVWLAVVSIASADDATVESLKFKFEVRLEQMTQAALGKLETSYREKLEALRQIYQTDGNLDAVLQIRSVVEALNAGEPAPATTLPRLAPVRETFDRAKGRAELSLARQSKPLYATYLQQLLAIEVEGGAEAGAATEEIVATKEAMKGVEGVLRYQPGTKIRGRMHIDVDDQVTFYVNGKRWQTFHRNSKNKGKFVSPVFEFTIGDRLIASARNSGGGLRHLKFVFVSEDERETIEFRVADFIDLRPVLVGKQRDFTLDQLKSELAVPARKDADKFGNTFEFENNSEWVWGKGNHSLLSTVIKPEMCRLR